MPTWLRGIALVALVIAVYGRTFANGYVSDDLVYIEGIRELSCLAGLRDIWLRMGATPQYYPLLHSVLWLEYQAWGAAPAGFHVMNVATHACVVLLAWRLLTQLAVPGAWLAAAIFAVHPVHVETVAWASERKNLLSAALALGSIHAYVRAGALEAPAGRGRGYALSLALYVGALLCKTVTISVPAVLLVLRWWRTGTLSWRDLRPLLPFLAVGLPLAMLTVWMERVHVGAIGAAWDVGVQGRVLIAGRAVCFYAGKLLWPYPLGFVYPRWHVDPWALSQLAYPVAVAATAFVLWVARGRIGRGPLAALLLFVGVLFPALGFFDVYPFLFSYVADHYQYHASLAPIALAAAGLAIAGSRRAGLASWAGRIAAPGLLGALAFLAYRESGFYRDEVTLIRRSAELQPESWAARYRLGAVLQNEGRNEEALAEMREALRLFPEHAEIHAAIAVNLAALGRIDEAGRELESALAGEVDDALRRSIHLRLGQLRVTQKRVGDAEVQFRAAAALPPASAEAYYSLGLVLRERGDAAGATAALRSAVAIDAGAAKAQYALGKVLLESGDAASALAPLGLARDLMPENATLREELAIALMQGNENVPAETELREAIQLDPRRADAHNLLGIVLWRRGDRDGAIAEFRSALALAPDHAGASRNLEQALAEERARP